MALNEKIFYLKEKKNSSPPPIYELIQIWIFNFYFLNIFRLNIYFDCSLLLFCFVFFSELL